jgi:hypothetical protein
MLTPGRHYCAALPLPVFDSDDFVPAATDLVAVSRTELCDARTGQVWQPMLLQLNRPEWFLQQLDGFNPPARRVPTLVELTFEAVRAYPDLMMRELHDRIVACDPRMGKPLRIDSFSSALSQDARIEMFKEGERVEKVGHNMRYCTFRVKGWQPQPVPIAVAAEE